LLCYCFASEAKQAGVALLLLAKQSRLRTVKGVYLFFYFPAALSSTATLL